MKRKKDRAYTISCGAIAIRNIDNEPEILLIKQFARKDRWAIPKGHLGMGETFEQCAIREVYEEAGVMVVLDVKLQNCFTANKYEEKTVHTWLAFPIGNHEPNHNNPNSEVADARWFKIGELPDITRYQREVVAEAVQLVYLRNSQIRKNN